jgi:hypothetical protein
MLSIKPHCKKGIYRLRQFLRPIYGTCELTPGFAQDDRLGQTYHLGRIGMCRRNGC